MRIWRLPALQEHAKENVGGVPLQLAALTDHTESDVNIVRFAPDAKLLASGGDDKQVILYHRLPGKGEKVFGAGKDGPNHENWRAARFGRCAQRPPADACITRCCSQPAEHCAHAARVPVDARILVLAPWHDCSTGIHCCDRALDTWARVQAPQHARQLARVEPGQHPLCVWQP